MLRRRGGRWVRNTPSSVADDATCAAPFALTPLVGSAASTRAQAGSIPARGSAHASGSRRQPPKPIMVQVRFLAWAPPLSCRMQARDYESRWPGSTPGRGSGEAAGAERSPAHSAWRVQFPLSPLIRCRSSKEERHPGTVTMGVRVSPAALYRPAGIVQR